MPKKLTTLFILLISLVAIAAFGFSKLTPSASPSSTFHSLNDIYALITNNTTKGTPNSPITISSSPTATTSHSIGEIYTLY